MVSKEVEANKEAEEEEEPAEEGREHLLGEEEEEEGVEEDFSGQAGPVGEEPLDGQRWEGG